MTVYRNILTISGLLGATAVVGLGAGCGGDVDAVPAAPAPVVVKEVAEELPEEIVEQHVEHAVGEAEEEIEELILETAVGLTLLDKLGHHALGIEVDARGGEILLSGEVELSEVRVAVEGVTKGVEGVTSVENQIIVEEMGPAGHAFVEVTEELQRERADAVVEARVNLALLEALGGEARDIAVVAEDGTVTLIGTVEDEVHHEDVLSRVRDVEGVEQVVDELRCGP